MQCLEFCWGLFLLPHSLSISPSLSLSLSYTHTYIHTHTFPFIGIIWEAVQQKQTQKQTYKLLIGIIWQAAPASAPVQGALVHISRQELEIEGKKGLHSDPLDHLNFAPKLKYEGQKVPRHEARKRCRGWIKLFKDYCFFLSFSFFYLSFFPFLFYVHPCVVHRKLIESLRVKNR